MDVAASGSPKPHSWSVRDGVDEVTLLAASGASTAAVVTENVYGPVLDGPLKSHCFAGPNGPVEFGIGGAASSA